MNERDIFIAALQEEDPTRRQAYLDQTCAGHPELRQQVENLLRLSEGAGSFLEKPAAVSEATGEFPGAAEDAGSPEAPGSVIGPYKLLERIGEGGMGTVWMAQQIEPVQRVVALKLIKAGMDSRQVIARFEAERQALALMDHPNIARVLDAGTTGAGRPYFVMDLVKGVPITRFCDEHQLTPRQRMELFLPVCQAVQHAHQKGIIHRDLKPSNVLVALYDGKPVPKVIDFGVAKAAGPSLTEKTLVTGFGAIVGTLEYMSPEQAQFNQVDVDTRSDIYTLGVLLYELLAGSPPFSSKELGKLGLLEMLRVIREQEPPRPSTRLSTSVSIASIAALRHTEPRKLSNLVRGDLDWITLKCLEKDRARRYETASGLARDIQHHLNDEPVEASPPSPVYRLRKLLRRNRGPVLAASLVLLTLMTGIIGTTWGFLRADQHRRKAEGALNAERQAREQAMAALRSTTDEIVQNWMAREVSLSEEDREFLRRIVEHFEGFAAITADDAESRAIRAEGYAQVGVIRHRLGELEEAEAALAKAVAIGKKLAAEFPHQSRFRQELARTHSKLGALLRARGQLKEAEASFVAALALYTRLGADSPAHPELRQNAAGTYNNLGNLLDAMGRSNEAQTAYSEALARQKDLAAEFPTRPEFRRDVAVSYSNLGNLFQTLGRPKEAEASFTDAVAIQERLVADFPARPEYRQELASSQLNLGVLLRAAGRPKEAERAFSEARALYRQLAADFPALPEYRHLLASNENNIALLFAATGRPKDAEAALSDALAIQRRLVAEFPDRVEFRMHLARGHNNLGALLKGSGRFQEAESSHADALAILKQLATDFPARPEYRQELASSQLNLGVLLRAAGRPKEAEAADTEAMAIYKRLAADFPAVPLYRLHLSLSELGLARVFSATGRPKDAEDAYTEALAIQSKLVADFPDRPEFRLQLARSRRAVGGLLEDQHRYAEAEAAFTEALSIAKRLASEFPASLEYRQELAGCHNNLGVLFRVSGRLAEAEAAYADAVIIKKQLAADYPNQPDLQHSLAGTLGNLATVCTQRGDFPAAKGYLEAAQPHHRAALAANPRHAEYRASYRNNLRALTIANARLDDQAGALLTAGTICDLGWNPPADAYDAACALAQCIPSGENHERLEEGKREAAVRFYGDRAMGMLRDSVARGWKDAAHTSKDTDLDPLRPREDFQRLLKALGGE
jgi:serine/threonine protein kinase/tetratricopeptide (TPR) repeat protein